MHLADRFTADLSLPEGYRARPYRGREDHPAMAPILTAYLSMNGESGLITAAEIDANYAKLQRCDPDNDIYLIEFEGQPVAYGRTAWDDLEAGTRDCTVFLPTLPEHLGQQIFTARVRAHEEHLATVAAAAESTRFRSSVGHPGPDMPATLEAKWLEDLGYEATEWGASLRNSDLHDPLIDEIASRPLPDGVEVRPVAEGQMREIVAAYLECFRGEWDFAEPTEAEYAWVIDSPTRDETLWQVAWFGDTVVGQVKPFIGNEENAANGYLRGYAEYIGTHHGWRNQGIAGNLLARSVQALRERGMTEAVLGVDTNNPGGAFQLYTKLGFELDAYSAIYMKPFHAA